MCVCLCVGDRVDVRRCACVTSRDTSLPTREATLQEVCPKACVYVNWERARQRKIKRAGKGGGNEWSVSLIDIGMLRLLWPIRTSRTICCFVIEASARLSFIYDPTDWQAPCTSSPCTTCVQHVETKNNFVCNLILRAVIKKSKMHSIQNRLATTCNLQLVRWRCCRMYPIPKRRFANKKT